MPPPRLLIEGKRWPASSQRESPYLPAPSPVRGGGGDGASPLPLSRARGRGLGGGGPSATGGQGIGTRSARPPRSPRPDRRTPDSGRAPQPAHPHLERPYLPARR